MKNSIINIISNNQSNWDKIVKSFSKYDVHYLSSFIKAFSKESADEAILLLYEDDDTKAINVLFKRDISNDPHFKNKIEHGKYFDLITPYGYGGWIIEGNDPKKVYGSYIDWCRDNNIVSEFTRFSLFSNSIDSYYGQVTPRMQNIVCDLSLSEEEMMMSFEHKVRKNYKKALKNNLEFIIDENGKFLTDFLEIYYNTMDRNEASKSFYFDEEFFKTLIQMKDNSNLFHVLHNGKIISTELVLIGSENMYSFLGGTNSEYYDLRPNDFLKVEVLKWGHNKGYKRFVLGGGYGADDGIFRYKKSFAPNGIVMFYTGQMIIDQEKYKYLCDLRFDEIDRGSSFFPTYRM